MLFRSLARVVRQVHRVLRNGAPFVILLPHPFAGYTTSAAPTFEDATRPRVRTFTEVFTELVRAGYRVDTLLEPELPSADGRDPGVTILRARKEGV